MQISLSHGNYIEKILRDPSGKLVRATFCVYENGGRIKARLVKVIYLDEYKKIAARVNELAGFVAEEKMQSVCDTVCGIVSPFFNSNILYAFGSKPRAPTIKF